MKTLQEKLGELPELERAAIRRRAAEIDLEIRAIEQLRRMMRQSQARLAQRLGVRQDSVSRLERRSDMLISTLRGYVRALGGELAIVARLPGHPPVRLEGLGDLAGRVARGRRPRSARARRAVSVVAAAAE